MATPSRAAGSGHRAVGLLGHMNPTPARERSRLEECSSEPIRTPGGIQPHGALLGINRESRRIVVVSENAEQFLGRKSADVLGLTIEDFVDGDRLPDLRRAAAGANPTPVEINGRGYDAIVHRDGPIAFVELEPALTEASHDLTSSAYAASLRLSALTNRGDLLAQVTSEFSELTGFDRVMIYHFHADRHGEVVSEVAAEGMEPYLGLHFPASDIPVQARQLYLTKISRAIISSVAPPVPLLADGGVRPEDVDLTHAELRAVSPFHLQFMRNMGQVSTVSFSLIYGGQLIGMITCAHNTERRLPFLARRTLEVLANQVALQIGALDEIARLTRRVRDQDLRTHLLTKMIASDDVAGALIQGDFTVIDVIPADAVALRLDGVVTRSADAPDAASLDRLSLAAGANTLATNALDADYPQLNLPAFAGALLVRLDDSDDYLAFFRREVIQSVDWLGDLTEQNRSETLSPRLSFSSWRQSVTGTSLPWGELTEEATALAGEVHGALARRHESRLAMLALLDPLTGLGNRRMLMDHIERLGDQERTIALLFIDLDDFKAVNDTHGHEAGDEVIIEIGRRLTEQTRADDRVVRLGGDEFVVMCENTTSDSAEALAHRIAAAIREPIGHRRHRTTASIGIVALAGMPAAPELVELADAAMYRAKQGGRDGISF
ncbi:hypothetical protein BH10ACT7_BH10ACT7_25880 [soil metagenome]